jgi:hypothetical protein
MQTIFEHEITLKRRKLTHIIKGVTRSSMLKLFLLRPLRALNIVFKRKCPQVIIVYPLIRLSILKASLERGNALRQTPVTATEHC